MQQAGQSDRTEVNHDYSSRPISTLTRICSPLRKTKQTTRSPGMVSATALTSELKSLIGVSQIG